MKPCTAAPRGMPRMPASRHTQCHPPCLPAPTLWLHLSPHPAQMQLKTCKPKVCVPAQTQTRRMATRPHDNNQTKARITWAHAKGHVSPVAAAPKLAAVRILVWALVGLGALDLGYIGARGPRQQWQLQGTLFCCAERGGRRRPHNTRERGQKKAWRLGGKVTSSFEACALVRSTSAAYAAARASWRKGEAPPAGSALQPSSCRAGACCMVHAC